MEVARGYAMAHHRLDLVYIYFRSRGWFPVTRIVWCPTDSQGKFNISNSSQTEFKYCPVNFKLHVYLVL